MAFVHCSHTGRSMIEGFEGFRSLAYWDPWGQVWTDGYGNTIGVHAGDRVTRAQADRDVVRLLAQRFEPAVRAVRPPTQNAGDALSSFAWNEGPGSMSWDVGRLVAAGDLHAAAHAMLAYDIAGGVMLDGLRTRRQDEARLLTEPDPPPPDPQHYRWMDGANRTYPALTMRIAGETVHTFAGRRCERHLAQRYDSLRDDPRKFAPTLNLLRVQITQARDRVYVLGHQDPHHPWPADDRHLGERWQLLNRRVQGQRLA